MPEQQRRKDHQSAACATTRLPAHERGVGREGEDIEDIGPNAVDEVDDLLRPRRHAVATAHRPACWSVVDEHHVVTDDVAVRVPVASVDRLAHSPRARMA